eukprot:PhM_4_TR18479/c0_g1_i7/m.21123
MSDTLASRLPLYDTLASTLYKGSGGAVPKRLLRRRDEAFFGPSETLPPGPDGEIPWLESDSNENAEFAVHIQNLIWRNQHPADCSKARFLVHKSLEYSIASDYYFASVDLTHAMILGRVFIWEKPWKWGPEPCGNRGTDCFFIPPTNCTLHHVGRISDKLPSSKIRESRTRTIRKTWWNTKDMRLIDAPDSFVPGGKEAAVAFREERKWGRGEYSTWANAHALRYLMRAPQPWLANIIEQEIIETMGFPWAEVPRLTAVHLRGG